MSRDMVKLQLSQHFCRATKIFWHATQILCHVGVTSCCNIYTFRSCNACTFSLTICAVLRRDIRHNFVAVARYVIKHLFYLLLFYLYYLETIKMTSQALSKFTENSRLRLVFSIQNLTRLVTSFYGFKIVQIRLFHRISVNWIRMLNRLLLY